VPLDAAALLQAAIETTGLSDFGDESFRDPFAHLVRALDDEAELHLVGRLLVRSEIVRCLQNRLRIEDTVRRDPTIVAAPIARPLFVIGTGRSGTSFLHELLALDPAARVPITWEVLYSCPPPTPAAFADDPRIARAHADVTLWEAIAPEYAVMHENGGTVPAECIFLTAHAFASAYWSGNNPVPSYARWLAGADVRFAYAYHRRMLQLLQHQCRRERWVLKAPSHLATLPTLLAEYPDARLVFTHRDPLAVMGSITSLVATLRWMRTDAVDYDAIVRGYAAGIAAQLEQMMRWRDGGVIPAAQAADVRYEDLVRDPLGAVRALYDAFDLRLSPEAAGRMRAYVAAKPKGRRGAHQWKLSDTGLDLATERRRYAAYQARFGVIDEVSV
jgi:hypothetical protein